MTAREGNQLGSWCGPHPRASKPCRDPDGVGDGATSMSPCRMRCHVTPSFSACIFSSASQGCLASYPSESRKPGSGWEGNRSGIVPACLPACRLIAPDVCMGDGRGGRGGARVWVGGEERYQGGGGQGDRNPPHHRPTRQPAPPRETIVRRRICRGEICLARSYILSVLPLPTYMQGVKVRSCLLCYLAFLSGLPMVITAAAGNIVSGHVRRVVVDFW